MAGHRPLVLASGSPRRRALLAQLGIALEVAPSDVDESELPGEGARDYVARLARVKAQRAPMAEGVAVLAADTAVVLDGRIFGKPRDPAHARQMLLELSGREHSVVTGVQALGPLGSASAVVETRVWFSPIPPAQADWYVATGEPMDKAGAYGIQDRGGVFVQAIEGSYSNVVGLPLGEALSLLERVGFALPWGTRTAAATGAGTKTRT